MFGCGAEINRNSLKRPRAFLAVGAVVASLWLVALLAPDVRASSLKELGGDTLRVTRTEATVEAPAAPEAPQPPEPPAPRFPEERPEEDTGDFGDPRVFELQTRDREGRGFRLHIDLDGDTLEINPEIRPRPRRGSAERQSVVRVGGDIVIEEDENVKGSVVCIGGDITVLGIVEGDVFALGGDITLRDGSVVEGDVNSIGGTVRTSRYADLGGDNNQFSVSLFEGDWTESGWVSATIWVFVFLAVFICGWLLLYLAPHRSAVVGEFIRARIWSSFFVGLALCAAFLPAFAILMITVIGIPLALLLPFIYGFVMFVGYVSVITLVGSRLASPQTSELTVRGLLFGMLIFMGAYIIARGFAMSPGIPGVFHFFGSLLALFVGTLNWVAAVIGFGAFALSRFGGRGVEGDSSGWSSDVPPSPGSVPPSSSLPPRPGESV